MVRGCRDIRVQQYAPVDSNQTVMLSNLPPEIVTEIASYLPYANILILRKAFTCEDLHDATNAHAIWLNLAKEYIAQNPHSDLANTQSLGSLTTDQIREQFEKRLIVDHVWQLSNQIYPSVKRIGGPSSAITTIRIAPGGRWLFAGTDEYSVYYWDLDADNPELVLLAPSHGAGNTPGAYKIVAAIDFLVERSDPLSGFIIAWAERDSVFDRDCRTSGEFLHLWDVIPQENGMLIAKHLKTIPLPYNGFSTKLSFNDRLVARTMEGRVDVYWWRECTETSLVRCTVQLKKKPLITTVCVIGCDGLLVFTRYQDRHKAQFFALEPESSEISQYGKAVSHATKMWSFRFSCKYHGREISRPYFNGENYYQIIAMHNGIFSLTIPASRPDEPSLTKVLDFDLHQRESDAEIYGLGLNKGYCRVGTELYRFGYSPGSTNGSYQYSVTIDSRLHGVFRHLENFHSFDGELGRLVSVCWDHLIIQDFSLPLYNLADVCPDSDAWALIQYW